MTALRHVRLPILVLCAAMAWGAPNTTEPNIGFLYPAGGKQGTVFEVLVGGQVLRGATDVYISGGGVSAKITQHYKPLRNLQPEQRQELMRRLRDLRDKRLAELPANVRERVFLFAGDRLNKKDEGMAEKDGDEKMGPVELPEHPLLRNLESKSLRELRHVADIFLNYKEFQKKQLNAQLAEMALLEVTIAPDAAPGDRELRLGGPLGLTNPMCFQVGTLPEVCEIESNDPKAFDPLPKEPPLSLPVVLNGQIMPGDVDRFRFNARQGQQIVIETYARRLVPFLADAVPGWFQAAVALYDAKGREVAFADAYLFRPDPVLFYEIPESGEYELEIRDSLYRGREDFIYRIAVGELPFITEMFPLGGREGVPTVAAIGGRHLPSNQLPLDTQPGGEPIRQTALRQANCVSNEVVYAVDTLPECNETEPNDEAKTAQRITLPVIINGRIARPGDVDVFQFEGRAGDEVVAEAMARRLYSPLDSLARLIGPSGQVLAWNDDYMQKEGDLHKDMESLTHHADSYVTARLPETGTYQVCLVDTQGHGGDDYAYRLRVSPPRPDFALRITPSSLSIPTGRAVPVTVHVLRKDGFQGEIELALKDAPAGFVLSGATVPPDRNHVRMTLTAPPTPLDKPISLRSEGRAQIGGKVVVRPAVPAEDVMQAFLYRHLVPSHDLLVAVMKPRWNLPPIERIGSGPVRVPIGGMAEVRIRSARWLQPPKVQLQPMDAAPGVTIQDVQSVPEGLAFHLKVEGPSAKVGFADNLIVEVSMEVEDKSKDPKDNKAAPRRRRGSLGVMPAIPFVVVQP